jgi:hypothetical protein
MIAIRTNRATFVATPMQNGIHMRLLPLISALALAATPMSAHEFWISPDRYTIQERDQLIAHLRVGEKFQGGSSPFLPSRFARFDLVHEGRVRPVTGRVGDRPALANRTPGSGLVTIVHQTSNSVVTYSEWRKFVNFVNHKDAAWVLEQHKARGLPDSGFSEVYSRYGKSLIAVGGGAGADQQVGLLTEIVALANPYTMNPAQGLPVRVLYQGKLRANAQVELFERDPAGTVRISLHRTNGNGEVRLPVKPGHEYLVDSVVLRPVQPNNPKGAVWESLWASLTFKVPG